MGTSLLGTRVERREDPTLLTGQGQYVGDVKLPGCLHARFVRSSEPHAKFRMDLSEAAAVKHSHHPTCLLYTSPSPRD